MYVRYVADRLTDKSRKNDAFPWWNVFDDICRKGQWLFWS